MQQTPMPLTVNLVSPTPAQSHLPPLSSQSRRGAHGGGGLSRRCAGAQPSSATHGPLGLPSTRLAAEPPNTRRHPPTPAGCGARQSPRHRAVIPRRAWHGAGGIRPTPGSAHAVHRYGTQSRLHVVRTVVDNRLDPNRRRDKRDRHPGGGATAVTTLGAAAWPSLRRAPSTGPSGAQAPQPHNQPNDVNRSP